MFDTKEVFCVWNVIRQREGHLLYCFKPTISHCSRRKGKLPTDVELEPIVAFLRSYLEYLEPSLPRPIPARRAVRRLAEVYVYGSLCRYILDPWQSERMAFLVGSSTKGRGRTMIQKIVCHKPNGIARLDVQRLRICTVVRCSRIAAHVVGCDIHNRAVVV